MKEPYPSQGQEVLCWLVRDPRVALVPHLPPAGSQAGNLAVAQPRRGASSLSPGPWLCLLSVRCSSLFRSRGCSLHTSTQMFPLQTLALCPPDAEPCMVCVPSHLAFSFCRTCVPGWRISYCLLFSAGCPKLQTSQVRGLLCLLVSYT